MENLKYKNSRKQELATGCTELIGLSKYDQKCMKIHLKHGKVTQIMHGASRNYRYIWDVSLTLIHCMSAQSQKGEDQIDLYLASGLGMSHNKILKETKCETLVD